MKKVLRIALILLVVLAAAFFGLRKYTKSFSPEDVAEIHNQGLDIKVSYSQPSKKNRHIFGREEDAALAPYGKVWRTGANEATLIEFKQDVIFAGELIKSGTYSLWTIPDQSTWKTILNSDTGQWGTMYNDGKNILTREVSLRVAPKARELFKIYFEDRAEGVAMILSWDQIEAIVPITKK
jgi:hypothetical protein